MVNLKTSLFVALLLLYASVSLAQTDSTLDELDKMRSESGIDPTRVSSRAGYTFLYYDQSSDRSKINNRVSLNFGVDRWSLSLKPEIITLNSGIPGEGFRSGFGDLTFSVLNAFYVKNQTALAGAVEFGLPTGSDGFGGFYFSVTPSITWSYTINPGLFLAVQPQYTFDIARDPELPELSVITIRSFIAHFSSNGLFLVFEPRPVIDLENETFDLILSPIIGKALGGGFNLIFLSEIPLKQSTRDRNGVLYQLGFNKSF